MKYFIIGLHASGKQEVIDLLSASGISCGKLFSNIEQPSKNIYNSFNYELYTMADINSIFENNAYIMIQELQSKGNINSYKYFEGLSKYSYENNEVFALSPDQFISIAPNMIKEDICIIWMDSTKNNRLNRYRDENRFYDFKERDDIETRDMDTFIKQMYNISNRRVLYFTNEEPCRISTIISTIIQYPNLLNEFVKNFN